MRRGEAVGRKAERVRMLLRDRFRVDRVHVLILVVKKCIQ